MRLFPRSSRPSERRPLSAPGPKLEPPPTQRAAGRAARRPQPRKRAPVPAEPPRARLAIGQTQLLTDIRADAGAERVAAGPPAPRLRHARGAPRRAATVEVQGRAAPSGPAARRLLTPPARAAATGCGVTADAGRAAGRPSAVEGDTRSGLLPVEEVGLVVPQPVPARAKGGRATVAGPPPRPPLSLQRRLARLGGKTTRPRVALMALVGHPPAAADIAVGPRAPEPAMPRARRATLLATARGLLMPPEVEAAAERGDVARPPKALKHGLVVLVTRALG